MLVSGLNISNKMAQNTVISAKVKEPRNLENKETRENLEHWFDQFRQYWKRDDRARHFMLPTSVWDTTKVHWGQAQEAEDSKLKRSAAEMKIDLEDLLDTVSGYLPFRYITQTLKSRTTCWKKVKEAVFEIYGVQTTATTQLNFAKIKKQPDETYRQMFERMVAHVEQHLPHPETGSARSTPSSSALSKWPTARSSSRETASYTASSPTLLTISRNSSAGRSCWSRGLRLSSRISLKYGDSGMIAAEIGAGAEEEVGANPVTGNPTTSVPNVSPFRPP